MKICTRCGRVEQNDRLDFCLQCGGALADYDASNSPSGGQPAPQGNGFCMKCGRAFNEYGVCPQCGNTAQNQAAPRARGAAQSASVSKPLDCVRSIFSASPFEGVQNAGKETGNTIWPLCAAAFVLLNALALAKFLASGLSAVVSTVLDSMMGGYGSLFGSSNLIGDGFGKLFLGMLFVSAALWIGSTALLKLPLASATEKLSFTQLLNLNSVALIPLAAASAVTFLLCLISDSIGAACGIVLLITGMIASAVLAYCGLQKITRFKKSPFWMFVAALAGDCVIVLLVTKIVLESII